MLRLENAALRVDLLDPASPVDAARQGTRYCHGGYIWQVHDAALGPLLSGPEFPHPAPSAFNGQGLPESFRHRTRDGRPLTWVDGIGLAPGIGLLETDTAGAPRLAVPCAWQTEISGSRARFATRHAHGARAYTLVRTVELVGGTVLSSTEFANVGDAPLALQWFAHPFFPLAAGRLRVAFPVGTALPENRGFALGADAVLEFRRPFLAAADDQFVLAALPPGAPFAVTLDHSLVSRVGFSADFVPAECPLWANARTFSVEPYLDLALTPGEARRWCLRYVFRPPAAASPA